MAKGYDVKYNLITFGGWQKVFNRNTNARVFNNIAYGGYYNYKASVQSNSSEITYKNKQRWQYNSDDYDIDSIAIFKKDGNWYDGTSNEGVEKLRDDLTILEAQAGYINDQEDGAIRIVS